ncbi:1,5-anhydro-D-fructose reductase [Halyomorpha halys]|uniref:1,5-anhydro-D-fructose reductase n=1 Tax=Halyomorpha halys TaxID=286706 RepID=UPI0034D2B921
MKMPLIGLGTWQSSLEEIDAALNAAIEAGYRHFDTAYSYQNETAIGISLEKMFNSEKIKREDLFIVTKLPMIGNRAEDVEAFLKKSLENLKLDYVDLYLIHIPVGMVNKGFYEIFPKDEQGRILIDYSTNIIEVWKAMEAQVDAGRSKSIGLSNFNQSQIKRILRNCRIPPANLQVEMHIYLQQKELVSFCKENNVTVCAYAPMGSPKLLSIMKLRGLPTEGYLVLIFFEYFCIFNQSQIKRILRNCRIPPANLQVEMHIYLQQKELVSFCKENNVTVCAYAPMGSPKLLSIMKLRGLPTEGVRILRPMEDPVINEIAKKYKKQPSHILLRYLMEYGVAVIPKSTNPSRIKLNIDVFDFELTKEDFERISALDRGEEGRMFGGRGNKGFVNLMESHPEYPFSK